MKLFLLKILFIKYRNSIFKYIINKNPNFEIDFFCHGWNIVLKDDIENMSIAEAWKIINIEWFLRVCLKN